jgi:uncharacterized protein YjbI with pentapeptide repeats
MGVLDRLLGREEYEAMKAERDEALDEASRLRRELTEAENNVDELRAKLTAGKIYMPSASVRSNLLKEMLFGKQKDFDGINGIGIYVANRNSMVYEMVSRIGISNARFKDCFFDKACFDTITFRNTEFHNVSFRGVSFEEVEFQGCTFDNCDFADAQGIDVQFDNCSGDLAFLRRMKLFESEADDSEAAELDDDEDEMEY